MKAYHEIVTTDISADVYKWVIRKYTPNPEYNNTIPSKDQAAAPYFIEELTGETAVSGLSQVEAKAKTKGEAVAAAQQFVGG